MLSSTSTTRGILTAPVRGILTGILTGALALSVAPEALGETADVIVRGSSVTAVASAVEQLGGDVELEIGLIDGVAAQVPADRVDALRADDRVSEVSYDAQVQLMGTNDLSPNHRGLTPKEAAIRTGGGDLVWNTSYDGTGIDVAIVDSGVEATASLPASRIVRGIDVSLASTSGMRDGYGHGTAMAGIVAGDGHRFDAVAKDARIVDVKVADDNGIADISQVLAGIDWVVSNRDADGMNIRVLSLSFGTDGTNDAATSPLVYAVEAAWRHGITVVVSAGNHGDSLGRLTTPAISPNVIAVGAADVSAIADSSALAQATVPAWSATGDGVRNPDLVVPGRSILGGRADDSAVDAQNPDASEGDYLLGSGTSQSAAYTAGLVAAMLEARPGLTPDEIKAMLIASTVDIPGEPATRDGHGVLDLGALFNGGNLMATPTDAAQAHGFSDGSGTLDGDRGRFFLEDADGNILSGERTVVGEFDREAWKSSTWSGSTWSGSTWSGSTWSGSTWSGSTWSGSTWSSSTWSGSTWSGSTWSASTWSNVIWGE